MTFCGYRSDPPQVSSQIVTGVFQELYHHIPLRERIQILGENRKIIDIHIYIIYDYIYMILVYIIYIILYIYRSQKGKDLV